MPAENLARGRASISPLLDRLGLPAQLLSALLAHADLVAASADRLGLVAKGDQGAIIERHIADSLLFAFARPPAPGERWVDIGSGAGFPGVVLACCYPDTMFTLVEPLQRRAGFLELAAASLGLGNIAVLNQRAEDLSARFDVALTRAWTDPTEAVQRLKRLTKPGGAAMVAATAADALPPGAQRVAVTDLPASVDSPAVIFMMSDGS